jgi:hypothetical protein
MERSIWWGECDQITTRPHPRPHQIERSRWTRFGPTRRFTLQALLNAPPICFARRRVEPERPQLAGYRCLLHCLHLL